VTDATQRDTSTETKQPDAEAEVPRVSKLRRRVRELVTFAVTAFVLLSARSSLADHYQVPTGSMRPSVHIDDRILVNKAAYGLRVPFTSTFIAEF
jgi:signal peptidase I